MGRYRGLVLPGLVILFGILALSAFMGVGDPQPDQGLLWPSQALWPVLPALIGIELVLRRRTSGSFASTVGLVLVVLIAVGVTALFAFLPPIQAPRQALDTVEPISEVTTAVLDLRFQASDVSIHGEPLGQDLFKSHLEYRDSKPNVSLDRSSGYLTISDNSEGYGVFYGPNVRRQIDVAVTNTVLWEVDVSGGEGDRVTMALGTVALKRVSLNGGYNSLTLRMGQPTKTVAVQVSGGGSQVTIHRPAGVAASVHAGGIGNSVHLDNQHLGGPRGFSAETTGYETATDRYAIDVSGGGNNVSVISP